MDATAVTTSFHAAATLAMAGVIWFVQVVHYPLFARVGEHAFAEYEAHHARLTTIIVAPLMLAELATAMLLAFFQPEQPLHWIGLGLLVVIWGSTFLIQVPHHRGLERGFDTNLHRRLVRTNWLRTVAWSGRAVIALSLLGLLA